jgi:SdrD B-like domain
VVACVSVIGMTRRTNATTTLVGLVSAAICGAVAIGAFAAGTSSAGATPAPMLTVSAFDDANENGVQDDAELGVAGVNVSVFRGVRLLAQAATNADGIVEFSKLAKGAVNVQIERPLALLATSATEVRTKVDAALPTTVGFGLLARAERTVTISVADISTVAGSGAATTIDGAANAAGFTGVRGLALANDQLIVETADTVRSIDTVHGVVSTVAGSAGSTGCVDGLGSAARFDASGPMVTDGVSAYVVDFCGASGQALRKVDVATGASATLWSTTDADDHIDGMAMAADGSLFTASTVGRTSFSTVIRRWNAGASVMVASLPATATTSFIAGSLAVDRNAIFVATMTLGASVDNEIRRFDLAKQSWSTLARMDHAVTALGSAGRFVYAGSMGAIVRVDKSTGQQQRIAGSSDESQGFANGSGTEIRFNGVTAIVSDGRALYVADSGNHRIRTISDLVAIV